MENAWAKPCTFDVEDAVEELTTCRKNTAQHVATENLQRLGIICGRTRKSLAKEHASRTLVYDFVWIKRRLVTIYCGFSFTDNNLPSAIEDEQLLGCRDLFKRACQT